MNFTSFNFFFFFNHQYYDPQTALIVRRQFDAHLIREFKDLWKKGLSTSMFWFIYHFWNIDNLHHIPSIETLQVMEIFIKKNWFNPNHCASFVIFQRYKIVGSSHVHPLRWLLRLWKFLKSLFECNDEGWNIVKDCNCHERYLFNHFIAF
jgi:hypothetical protein